MEAMGIMGFMIGGCGMTFALVAMGQIGKLKQELDELKNELEKSGTIQAETRSIEAKQS